MAWNRKNPEVISALRCTLVASAFLLAIGSMTGCVSEEDRRLAADEQSCQSMGHADGTPEFKQCMIELNLRRCATRQATKQGGIAHEITRECTRLP
jgi:hypothetical protein